MIPGDVAEFLRDLDSSYDEIFKTLYTSPCKTCNDGKPRLVHRSPKASELGGRLKTLLSRYPSPPRPE